MRIAYLNMSDPSAQCPDGWREVPSPISTCRRQLNTPINSVNYISYYSRVCGRIIAYQLGTPNGFLGYDNQNQRSLDDAYVDGILSMGVTFVKLEYLMLEFILLTAIHYGMARAVMVPLPVVNSTIHHGSVSSYPSLLQRILRYNGLCSGSFLS